MSCSVHVMWWMCCLLKKKWKFTKNLKKKKKKKSYFTWYIDESYIKYSRLRFKNLRKLERFFFTDSPLYSVSDNAFMDLTSLLYLFHDNTNLTTIPKAVTNLPSLVGLSLDNTKIRCACPNLDWINTWSRRSKVKILGNFHNIRMTLCEYIYSEFPKCT